MNHAQNKALHYLLNNRGLIPQKEMLVLSYTNGRSRSSKDLSFQEAGELISYLKTLDHSHKMRRKIISMAHELGWHLPPSPNGEGKGVRRIDMNAINEWCKKYGFGKKELNEYTESELPKLVTQFQNGPYKYYISHL